MLQDTGKTLAFVGDSHAEIQDIYPFLKDWERRHGHKINAAVSVGDFGIWYAKDMDFRKYWDGGLTAPIPTYVCPGNHEDFALIYRWVQHPAQIPNMHLMLDGHVTSVCGVRIGAIWGCFSHKSWRNQERIEHARMVSVASGQPARKAMHIYKPAVEELKTRGQFDVMVTHEAPMGMSPLFDQPSDFIKQQLGLDSDERASGCPGFNEVHEINKPKLHFFGHFHTNAIVQVDPVKVVCLDCFDRRPDKAVAVVDFSGETPVELYGC